MNGENMDRSNCDKDTPTRRLCPSTICMFMFSVASQGMLLPWLCIPSDASRCVAWLSKMTELATCILERCGSGNPHFDMIDGRPGPDKRRGWPT